MLTRRCDVVRLMTAAGLVISMSASVLADPASPLAGPRIETEDLNPSLVEKNIDGTMRPLEVPVAEAALEMLELDEPTRAAVDAYLADRAAVIDAIVKENFATLEAMRSAKDFKGKEAAPANADQPGGGSAGPGGPSGRLAQFRQLRAMFAPVLEDGPLEDRIADLLPESQRAEYLGLIEEHHQARMAARMERGPMDDPMLFEGPGEEGQPAPGRRARPAGRGEGRGQGLGEGPGEGQRARMAEMASQMQTLRLEIRRSVERLVGDRRGQMEELVAQLDLTSEQEVQVREILRKRAEAAQTGEASARDRASLMRDLAAVLTPEQRAKFRELAGPPQGRRAQPPVKD